MVEMNRWQKVFVNTYYEGKMPRSNDGKERFRLLGSVKNSVIVDYPEFNGKPAHTEVYKVVEEGCNMPEGIIDVRALSSNLPFWLSRGYSVKTV